jgi:hypothetical protein
MQPGMSNPCSLGGQLSPLSAVILQNYAGYHYWHIIEGLSFMGAAFCMALVASSYLPFADLYALGRAFKASCFVL